MSFQLLMKCDMTWRGRPDVSR